MQEDEINQKNLFAVTGIRLTEGPVTYDMMLSSIMSLAENTGAGGHSLFIGQVRADRAGAKEVTAIEYTAYEKMFLTEGEKIIKSVYSEFRDVKKIEIIHSRGMIKAGEISLFVMVSAGHRREAIEACNKIVEQIKTNLPVWKKEIFEDNSFQWHTDNKA